MPSSRAPPSPRNETGRRRGGSSAAMEAIRGQPVEKGGVPATWTWKPFWMWAVYFTVVYTAMYVLVAFIYPLNNAAVSLLPSSTAAFSHSTLVNIWAYRELRRAPFDFRGANTRAALRLFAMSSSFFLVDSVFCYAAKTSGYPQFIGHHLAAVFIVAYTVMNGYGGPVMVSFYFVGELSNSLQNTYLVIDSLGAQPVFESTQWYAHLAAINTMLVKPAFLVLFLILRGIAAPALLVLLLYVFYFRSGRYHARTGAVVFPHGLLISWIIVIVGILAGSFLFARDNWSWFDVWFGAGDAGSSSISGIGGLGETNFGVDSAADAPGASHVFAGEEL